MSDIVDYTNEGFFIPFELEGCRYYLVVNAEMFSIEDALDCTGRYLIYCLHPANGSCTFSIFINRSSGYWDSEDAPEYIRNQRIGNNNFIDWIGEQIEERKNVRVQETI